MATNTQAALEGQPWTQATLDAALLAVAKDVNITPDAPGATVPALLLHSALYSVLVQHSFCLVCQLRPAALHCHKCLKSSLSHLPGVAQLTVGQSNLEHPVLPVLCCAVSITKHNFEPAACELPVTSVTGPQSRTVAPDM